MKKVLLVFFMAVSAIVLFSSTSFAAGTGNLVFHFQKWDGDYSAVGMNTWGEDSVTMGQQNPDQVGWMTDDFGVYVEFDGITAYDAAADPAQGTLGMQVVGFDGSTGSWSINWGKKLVNFEIPREKIQDGKTLHVYAFEGSINRESDISTDLYADPIYANPDAQGVLVVYFDPSNAYEENLGVHSWGWAEGSNASAWNTPLQIFQKVGRTSSGTFVYAGILEYTNPIGTGDNAAGALVYYGDGDNSKKTGNLVPQDSTNAAYVETPKAAGQLDTIYVLNKGDANTTNNNVWVNDPTTFADEAFTFRLVDFKADDMSGTYAVDPNTIIVKLSSLVNNPYEAATTEAEQTAALDTVKSWFTVKEVTGTDTYGSELAVDHVDFAKGNATLDTFVVVLADPLDNTKDYEIFFNLGMPEEALTTPKDVTVTLNVTAPTGITNLYLAGTPNGWTPDGTAATQVGTTDVWTITFTVSVTDPYTTVEYKYTQGSWETAEMVSGNRTIVIPNNGSDTLEYNDTVAFTGDSYAATARGEATMNLKASLPIAMDTEAPVISFISPTAIVGQPAASRIIEVAWGQPFDQNLFPSYRAIDNRDGDITVFVYVPSGANSTLDTRTEGDYTIMLRVVDKWGNVTEETFIFRVVMPAA